MINQQYGLIGKTLKYSFSKKYFSQKFENENIQHASYELYELETIEKISEVLSNPKLRGFNITIPYKEEIMPFLHQLDVSAQKVGAVNVVKVLQNGQLKGYNSDYYGFRESLEKWTNVADINHSLILGTGGAAKAIKVALKDLGISFQTVSRSEKRGQITYGYLTKNPGLIDSHKLIINCTPLGTFPHVEGKPEIDYQRLTPSHLLYDLVYNPEITAFMNEALKRGAKAKNGLEMLILQAEKSWEIWNKEE